MSNIIDSESLQDTQSTSDHHAWTRLKTESRRAYTAFCLFRDSEKRSLTDVAAQLVPQCSTPNVARWSTMHNWKDRVWAWDAHQDELQQKQEARDRSAMHRRHLKVSMLMQEIAVTALLELRAKSEQKLPLNLSAGEANHLLVEGSKLERLTLGVGKDRRQYTQINVNLGTYEYDDEEEQEKVLPGKDDDDENKPN
jgi:hypothetical protein